MVEVFKTNVEDKSQAARLLSVLKEKFTDYKANFDLQDCDRILRVESTRGFIHTSAIIELLSNHSVMIEVLPDEIGGWSLDVDFRGQLSVADSGSR